MGLDYYSVLKVGRKVSDADLKRAYKNMAIRWHPDKNPTNKTESEVMFKQITEAFEVLSDPQKRAIYDRYGEEGLKGQSPTPPTSSNGGGFRPRKPEDVYSETFRSSSPSPGVRRPTFTRGITFRNNPYHDTSFKTDYFPQFNNEGATSAGLRKAPPVENKLPCTLEELYLGSTRKMKISRNIIQGGRVISIDEVLTITVLPGWKKGTKITFPKKGNEQPGFIASDVTFIIDEKPHEVFKRDGSDLVMVRKITLAEALVGCTFSLTSLSGSALTITCNEIIAPGYEKVIPGEGMPNAKEKGKMGNLRIKFEIAFPTNLTFKQKDAINRALSGHV